RPPASGASPPSAAVAAKGHGAGAGEEEDAGAIPESAEIGGFHGGDHRDGAREIAKPPRETPTLGVGPDAPRRDDERADVAASERPSSPEAAREIVESVEPRRRLLRLAPPSTRI